MNEILTIEQADQLGQLVRAVRSHGKLQWYVPCENGEVRSITYTLRAFVISPEDHSFAFDDDDTDIRDLAVWLTAIFERFIPVRDILAALANADIADYAKPMALFEGK